MPNRGLEVRNVILEGLTADSELGVMQPGDSEAQSQESSRQLNWVALEELCDPPNAAAPSRPLGP